MINLNSEGIFSITTGTNKFPKDSVFGSRDGFSRHNDAIISNREIWRGGGGGGGGGGWGGDCVVEMSQFKIMSIVSCFKRLSI